MSRARDLADSADLSFDGTTLVVDDANDRVGVNDSSPEAKLDVYIGTGLTTFGDFSDSLRVQGGNNTSKYVPITFGGYGNYAPASIAYLVTTGTGNTKGDLVFGTRDVTTDTRPTERMRIDSAGRVTMPYQVAFTAGGTQSSYASRVTIGSTTNVVPFNSVTQGSSNTVSGWDNNTHTFTAPVTGSYLVSCWGIIQSVGTFELSVEVNSSKISRFYIEGDRGVSGSVIIYMSANDYMQIASSQDIYLTTNAQYSGMSVTLLG